MSFFNKIKKLITADGGSDDDLDDDIFKKKAETPSPNKTKSNINEFEKNIFINGISGTKTAIAFDNVLNLCAIGFNDGTFKIFGKLGYETPLKTHSKSMVKKLFFIINSPFILAITDTTIEKWDYDRRTLNNILIYKTRITAICLSTGLKHLFFATEDSIIQTYNYYNNFLSSHQIYLENEKPILNEKTTSIIPSCLKINPSNPNLLLVGYNNGLIVIWNLECKKIEKSIDSFIEKCGYCTSLSWSRKGSKFIAGFLNGEIHLIKYSIQNSTSILIYKSNNNTQQYYPIEALEILYTNSKKMVIFKGTYSNNSNEKSLILIKGDNFKNPSHLSSIEISPNIISFCPITTLPWYNNNGNLLSVLLIEGSNDGRLLEYKIDSKTTLFSNPILYDEINKKSFNSSNKVKFMKSYQCDSNTIELIYQLHQIQGQSGSINGGNEILTLVKQPNITPPSNQQLMITVHENNTIQFWNSTDPKNILYLGNLELSITGSIINISFCTSTLLLSISTTNSDLLIYHFSDFSKRIDQLIYYNNTNTTNSNTESIKELPNAVFDVCKLMGKIILDEENITSIVMNPYKTSYSTRILIGTDIGNVYHYIVSIVNNKSNNIVDQPIIPSSQVVYTLAIFNFGVCSTNISSSDQIQQQQQEAAAVVAITSISFCFYPIRDSDIDTSLAYIGNSEGYVMAIDLQTMKVLNNFKVSTNSAIQSIFLTNKRGDLIQFLFFGSINHDDAESFENITDLSTLCKIYNNDNAVVSGDEFKTIIDDISITISTSKEISMYNISFSNNKLIQYKRLVKQDGGGILGNNSGGSLYSTTDNHGKSIFVSCDSLDSKLELYNTVNLEKLKTFSLLPIIRLSNSSGNNIRFIVTQSLGNAYLYNDGLLYCISINGSGSSLNQYPTLFVDNIPMPQQLKPKTTFSKLFSSAPSQQTTELTLDRKFNQEGLRIPTPHATQQVSDIANMLNQAKIALQERGEKLEELEERTQIMNQHSHNFLAMAKQLNK